MHSSYILKKQSTTINWCGKFCRIVSEPVPSNGEEGYGHTLTFELSPGQNVDLTNQKC